ncbi:hypothetical protein B0H19DRAFT_1115671 [Mycena capillaripes]|nr:hypothetical protein B0H19DRAFT_1115671 [Mycena capillaripes]
MDIRAAESTPPAPSKCVLTFEDLSGREALNFQQLISESPALWAAGGLTGPSAMTDEATANWRSPRSAMPLVVEHLCRKVVGESAPPEVATNVLAAIGISETYHRGHLFAIIRLLYHFKKDALTPLCTEYISQKSYTPGDGGISHIEQLTASISDPANLQGIDRPPVKRRRLSDSNLTSIIHVTPTEKQLEAFDSALNTVPADVGGYAMPDRWHQLPFPFIYDSLPYRFKLLPITSDDDDILVFHAFEYMGREAFPLLVEAVSGLGTSGSTPPAAFLLGAIGVGKSHLLAALTVFLRRQGKFVVYVPDCRDLVAAPVNYMAAALLCAFSGRDAENIKRRHQIRTLATAQELEAWCRKQHGSGIRLIFIVDQLNGLEERTSDMTTKVQRELAKSLLLSLYTGHICVRSSSANDNHGYELLGRGQKELIINFRQTLTEAEVVSWMARFTARIPKFSYQELEWYNDYVGRVFLFYPLLLDYPGTMFATAWEQIQNTSLLRLTSRSIQQFATKILTTCEKATRENYLAGVRAFLTGTSTKSIRLDLIDHRYCTINEVGDCGHVTSGLVRNELFQLLEKEDRNITLSIDWLDAGLTNAIGSPPVVAFMVEKSILTTLLQGVQGPGSARWSAVAKHSLPLGCSLPRNLPFALKSEGQKRSLFVIPEAFNFEAIDGVYVEVDNINKHARVVPVQITLAKSHIDSAAKFYANWHKWVAYFSGYTLETAFLWIVEKFKPGVSIQVDENPRTTRGGTKANGLAYSQHFVHLQDIAPRVWTSLVQARETQEMEP